METYVPALQVPFSVKHGEVGRTYNFEFRRSGTISTTRN